MHNQCMCMYYVPDFKNSHEQKYNICMSRYTNTCAYLHTLFRRERTMTRGRVARTIQTWCTSRSNLSLICRNLWAICSFQWKLLHKRVVKWSVRMRISRNFTPKSHLFLNLKAQILEIWLSAPDSAKTNRAAMKSWDLYYRPKLTFGPGDAIWRRRQIRDT